jgi:hypothetical protein
MRWYDQSNGVFDGVVDLSADYPGTDMENFDLATDGNRCVATWRVGNAAWISWLADAPVAVAFQEMNAVWDGGAVMLTWRIESDEPLASLRIYRADDETGPYVLLVDGLDPAMTRYADRTAVAGHGYRYLVAAVKPDRSEIISTASRVKVPLPDLALAQNVPNPFNPSTRISYSLDREHTVTITIYDATGRRVRVLDEGRQSPGTHGVEWDGRGESGRSLASGVYFYTLRAGSATRTRKMVLLK